jgi:hypothetical protein
MTEHFTWTEAACHDGTHVPEELRPDALRLAVELEKVRPADGLEVVSWYRTPAWNTRKGGAKNSRHLVADGADVRPVVRVAGVRIPWALVPNKRKVIAKFFDDVINAMAHGKADFGGVGYYPGLWCHLDCRPKPADGHVARWSGEGIGSEVA